ncbi:hypothetical protein F5B19DRAFT_459775 [Rostrohypoxylon terebratum]|nr:hypothetical protein F5B19DRAFT_459775 [Rostrohypoxylon terebratum]
MVMLSVLLSTWLSGSNIPSMCVRRGHLEIWASLLSFDPDYLPKEMVPSVPKAVALNRSRLYLPSNSVHQVPAVEDYRVAQNNSSSRFPGNKL